MHEHFITDQLLLNPGNELHCVPSTHVWKFPHKSRGSLAPVNLVDVNGIQEHAGLHSLYRLLVGSVTPRSDAGTIASCSNGIVCATCLTQYRSITSFIRVYEES